MLCTLSQLLNIGVFHPNCFIYTLHAQHIVHNDLFAGFYIIIKLCVCMLSTYTGKHPLKTRQVLDFCIVQNVFWTNSQSSLSAEAFQSVAPISSAWLCPVDPAQVVGERKMMEKLSSLTPGLSPSMQDTLAAAAVTAWTPQVPPSCCCQTPAPTLLPGEHTVKLAGFLIYKMSERSTAI